MIMLVIADGLPAGADDSEIEGRHLKDTVQWISAAGIEVYGVGVGIYHPERFAEYYPNQEARGDKAATGHVLLDKGEGLSDAVLRQLTNLMIRSTGYQRTEAQKQTSGLRR